MTKIFKILTLIAVTLSMGNQTKAQVLHKMYSWGGNTYGELGYGNTTNQNSPQLVGSATNWIKISGGVLYTLAINANGELYSWGFNTVGQLGLGNITNQTSPVKVGTASNWTAVAAGANHALAVNSKGELYSWGTNYYGELGIGNFNNQQSPQRVGSASDWVSVTAGYGHSLAINSKGEIYAWGLNSSGQLGLGTITAKENAPKRVGSESNWISVVAGGSHTLAINSSGKLYSWGSSNAAQLGLGNSTNYNSPQRVGTDSNWSSVVSGYFHTVAINTKGQLYAWGGNGDGQLGLGTNTGKENVPNRVGNDSNWVTACVGRSSTQAINSRGELYSWGYNDVGQLGLGNITSQNTPQRVGTDSNWTFVSAGQSHTIALTTDHISKIKEISNINKFQLSVYPNPVEDHLQIRLVNQNKSVSYRVYNISGVVVLEGSITDLQMMNTQHLQSGVYFIEVDGLKAKFIKN